MQLWHSTMLKEQLQLETDAAGIGLGESLLQARDQCGFQGMEHPTIQCLG